MTESKTRKRKATQELDHASGFEKKAKKEVKVDEPSLRFRAQLFGYEPDFSGSFDKCLVAGCNGRANPQYRVVCDDCWLDKFKLCLRSDLGQWILGAIYPLDAPKSLVFKSGTVLDVFNGYLCQAPATKKALSYASSVKEIRPGVWADSTNYPGCLTGYAIRVDVKGDRFYRRFVPNAMYRTVQTTDGTDVLALVATRDIFGGEPIVICKRMT